MSDSRESTSVLLSTTRGPVEYASRGAGRAVLALHGAMGGYDQGLLLAETIGPVGYRYVAISRPGYLGTPLSAGPAAADQADLAAGVLDTLGIGPVAVMAVSGGGPCAIQFALRHASRCRALVLVSTSGAKVDTPIPWSFHVRKLLARWPWFVSRMRERATRDPEAVARRSILDPVVRERTLANPESARLLTALTMSTLDRMPARLPGTDNDISVTRTTDHALERIAAPTLVVHGTVDRMVPFEQHARPLAARIPRAELVAIEGGEHVAIFTHRDEVRARVASFLAEHYPARGA